jgi:hypothetical protein
MKLKKVDGVVAIADLDTTVHKYSLAFRVFTGVGWLKSHLPGQQKHWKNEATVKLPNREANIVKGQISFSMYILWENIHFVRDRSTFPPIFCQKKVILPEYYYIKIHF